MEFFPQINSGEEILEDIRNGDYVLPAAVTPMTF
jgi:hypothetical protein